MNRSIAHQDESGGRRTPYGVFRDGQLIGAVADPYDEYEIERVATADGGTARGVEVLTVCHKHPTVAAVDCIDCVPAEEG